MDFLFLEKATVEGCIWLLVHFRYALLWVESMLRSQKNLVAQPSNHSRFEGLYIHYSNQHKHFGDGKLPQEAPCRWTISTLWVAWSPTICFSQCKLMDCHFETVKSSTCGALWHFDCHHYALCILLSCMSGIRSQVQVSSIGSKLIEGFYESLFLEGLVEATCRLNLEMGSGVIFDPRGMKHVIIILFLIG